MEDEKHKYGRHLVEMLQGEMTREVNKIVEEEAEKAGREVVKRVRGMAGQLATTVCARVNYEKFGGGEIVIRVNINESFEAYSKNEAHRKDATNDRR